MQTWIIDLINRYGYFAVAALIAVENIFPPIPSELILTFGGFLTTCTYMTPPLVILWSTVGSLLGAVVLYVCGRFLPAEKLGRFFRFRPEEVEGAKDWFLRRGQNSVLFCRCIPIMRSLISVPAGITSMNRFKFLLFTAIGSALWNTLLILLGAAAGSSWAVVAERLGIYSWIVAAVLSLGIAALMLLLCRKKFRKKAGQASCRPRTHN